MKRDYVTEARQAMQRYRAAAVNVSDSVALTVPELFEPWNPNEVEYQAGDRRRYGDILYKCIQNHTSQENWAPDRAPTLWQVIDTQHAGTLEDPIPAKVNMEYIKGKYYLEDGKIYLMNRQGMEDGEEITLQYLPSQLVGQYFELVEG